MDIFPYDAVCSEPNAAKRQRKRCTMWQSLSYLYHSKHIVVPHKGVLGAAEKAACRIAHYVVRAVLSPERINRGFDKAAMIAKDDPKSDMLMASSYAAIDPYPKSMLLPPDTIEFEGKEFLLPPMSKATCLRSMVELGISCRRRISVEITLRRNFTWGWIRRFLWHLTCCSRLGWF